MKGATAKSVTRDALIYRNIGWGKSRAGTLGGAADGGDLKAIDAMVRDMGINPWSDTILNGYRQAAETFVREKRAIIQIIARELLRRREMTGSELDELLSSLSQIEV